MTREEHSPDQPLISDTAFSQALDVLTSFSLIETRRVPGISGKLIYDDILIHPLTREALRFIFANSIATVGRKTAQVTIREDGQDYRQRITVPKDKDITWRIMHDLIHATRLKHEIEVFSESIPAMLRDSSATVEPTAVLIGILWFHIMANTNWYFNEGLPSGSEFSAEPTEALKECIDLIYSDEQADDFLSIVEKADWSPREYWHTDFTGLYDRVAHLWRSKSPTGPIIRFTVRLADDEE